ncbi:RNA polymerase sigma-70 factor [Gracilimonas mengyeensis]|uniref:RNA polymerase sigma-70 factor, ECF subfamily n=1 Tax=Gracilimonas mengyeensis TaxID=1302730 RepID=A0A521CQT0_9BACT|nr:RNA polymerase sigma-70 factor [Gracilimonas mengyeensis]SMO61758.1 RNA polymerase sigma-70 factor, ECF subfamily [Gracilimonas mengyeensis]
MEAEKILRQLFDEQFYPLVFHAYRYVKDYEQAREIVQDVFVKVWQNVDQLQQVRDKEAYLYKAVKHSSLNFLKHVEVRKRYVEEEKSGGQETASSPEEKIISEETQRQVHDAINKLPAHWKEALVLSKYQGLNYRDIATRMNISQKTVEKYISKAYRFLRGELNELLLLVLLILELFKKN